MYFVGVKAKMPGGGKDFLTVVLRVSVKFVVIIPVSYIVYNKKYFSNKKLRKRSHNYICNSSAHLVHIIVETPYICFIVL